MPTLCSMCGGTYGRCEGCKKADAMIQQHENAGAREALSQTLKSFEIKPASTGVQQQHTDAPAPDQAPPTT